TGTLFLLAAMLSTDATAASAPASDASSSPSSFDAYLAQGYRRVEVLAAAEGEQGVSRQFRGRAALAARGTGVAPLTTAEAKVTGWTNREAGFARRQLVSRLDNGGRERQPLLAAIAQVNFDCWLAPLPKQIGSVDGDECRRRFYFALA